MNDSSSVNSEIYWDTRFAQDWVSREGPRQSRFFSRLAVDHLPGWLMDQVRMSKLTLVDWGCAQGDGTDVWSAHIPSDQLVGIDFSQIAIDEANTRYPAITFICEDWVKNEESHMQQLYDVVFSSNTLEHFHRPYDVLEMLCRRASKAVVLALPYREIDRIEEHFYTFLPENVPAELGNGFRLVWSRVVDCRQLPNTLWGGDQIVLVYAQSAWVSSLRLLLKDCQVESEGAASEINRLSQNLAKKDDLCESLSRQVRERDGWIDELNQNLVARDQEVAETERNLLILQASVAQDIRAQDLEIGRLTQQLTASDHQIGSLAHEMASKERDVVELMKDGAKYVRALDEMKASTSWKITSPLRWISTHCRTALGLPGGRRPVRLGTPKSLWRSRLDYLTKRLIQGYRRHGLIRSLPLSFKTGKDLAVARIKRSLQHRAYERRLQELRDMVLVQRNFIDIFHVPMGWSTPLFQRFQHMSLQAAELNGLALYGGHIQVDKDMFVFKRAEGGVIVFDALDQRVNQCIFEALSLAKCPVVLRLQSIDLATSIDDVGRFVQAGYSVLYEYIDEINEEITGSIPPFVHERHRWLLKNPEVFVVATADKLYQQVKEVRDARCVLSTNGVDLDHWRKKSTVCPDDMKPILESGLPVVGYHGALAKWLDYDLLRSIAATGRYEVVLIGYEHDSEMRDQGLLQQQNVHFLGSKSYFMLNDYAQYYTVGILPFKRYMLTESVSPVKLFEYMAAGKPVVTTDLVECFKYESCLVSTSHEEFLEHLELAVRAKDDEYLVATLKLEAAQNSWKGKAVEIYKLLGIQAEDS